MRTASFLLFVTAATGCGAATPPSAAEPEDARPRCSLVRVERVTRESDQDADTLVLTAVYRAPGPAEDDADPIQVEVQATRERADDLRAQLEARPEPMCEPDPGAPGGYRVRLPF